MRRILPCLLLPAALLLAMSARAEDGKKLKVIASIPDFADMAREIGGEFVEVESLAKGIEDLHAVPVRPSFAAKLAGADVLIEMGLGNEHAWLPALVEASHNPKLKPGGKGNIVAAAGQTPLEVPADLSRREGELHAEGNPHMNLDPAAGKAMARNIADGLIANSPGRKQVFEANLAKYLAAIAAKEKEWQAAAEKLKGVKFVSYHNHWAYWARYFGMEYAGTLENKPGIPPSGSHLAQLMEAMKRDGVKLVVREPQFSEKLPRDVAEKTGGTVVKLAVMVGGLPEAKTWIGLIDANLKALLEAAARK